MIASDLRRLEAVDDDHFECVVIDDWVRAPGFYRVVRETYYVAHSGAVYLVRAPGHRVLLHEKDDLPPGAERAPEAASDAALQHLAAAVEVLARDPGGSEIRS